MCAYEHAVKLNQIDRLAAKQGSHFRNQPVYVSVLLF
jgi:hypothetical protein